MKKRLGQIVFSFFIWGFILSSLNASTLPVLKQTGPYRAMKALYAFMGIRPLEVTVYDEFTHEPIQNAIVMLGENNQTFENNWGYTDESGKINFNSLALPLGALTVSVKHADYSGMTIFQTEANQIQVPLTKLENQSIVTKLKGEFTNWPEMEDFDGTMHLGMMIPFLDIVSLTNFNTDKILAPYVKAKIYKTTDVPGNIVMPSQEERFLGFIPVYVSKPRYIMPFRTGSTQNLLALTGQVPFSKVAGKFVNKKPLTEILNLVSLTQFGMVTNHTVPGKTTKLNIPLTYNLKPRYNVTAKNVPARKDIIYVSLSSLNENPLNIFPLDFKTSARNEREKSGTLKAPQAGKGLPAHQNIVATVAADLPKNTDDKRALDGAITGGLQRPEASETQIAFNQFLALHDLTYDEEAGFSYTLRHRLTESIDSHVNMSFINIVVPSTKQKRGSQQTWWTVITPAAMPDFKLPILPQNLSKPPALKKEEELRWALSRFGLNDKDYIFNYNDLSHENFSENVTHFSRNEITLVE